MLLFLIGAAPAPGIDHPAGGLLGGFPGRWPLACFCAERDEPLGGITKRRSTEEAPELQLLRLVGRVVPVQERRCAP